jgi:hypothetical protein
MARDAKIVYTAEDRTGAATAAVKRNLAQVNEFAAAAGLSFAALGAAGTLAGIVAAVKKVNDGVDALNDLKDATGASIESISGLENVARMSGASFDTVGTSLIKFNQALGATLKPGSDAEKVLKAIGLNAKELRELDPAEALRQTAVALNQFADDGNKARATQELFGKSLREVAPYLKDLAEAGQLHATVTTKQAEEAEKFNKNLFKMQTHLSDLGRTLANPVVTRFNELADAMKRAEKEGDELWKRLLRIGTWSPSPALSYLLNLGYEKGRGPVNGYTDARRELENAERALANPRLTANEMAIQLQTRADAQQRLNSYLDSSAGGGRGMLAYGDVARGSIDLPPEPGKVAAAKRAEDDPAYKAALKAAEERQKLRNQEAEDIRKFFLLQEELAVKHALKERELMQTFHEDYLQAHNEMVNATLAAASAAETELEMFGKSKSEIAQLTLERMKYNRVLAVGAGETEESIDAIDRQIHAQQRLVSALRGTELREANVDSAREAARAWEQVADSFVDNLMRGGKSVAQYLKDLFRTLVLRPILAPIGGMAASLVTGMMPGAAQAGTGASLGGIGSSLSSLGGMFGGGGMFSQAMGATMTNGLFGGFGANMANIGTLMSGGSMMGALGAAMPYVGLALAAISLLKGAFKGETRSGGQYNMGSLVAAPSGGEIGEFGSASSAMAEAVNQTLRALGSSAQLTNFMSGIEKSEKGKGFAFAGGTLSSGAAFGQGWGDAFSVQGHMNRRGDMTDEQAAAAGGEELKQAYLQAIQAASDIPKVVADKLRDLDIDSLSGDALDKLIAEIDQLAAAATQLQAAFRPFRDLTLDMAAGLAGAGVTADQVASFRQNYFTDEERRADLQRELASTFQQLGVVMPTTLAQFRELVLAQDPSTESGQKLIAALLGINEAFKDVYGAAEVATAAIETMAQATEYVHVNVGDMALAATEAAAIAGQAWRQTADSIEQVMRELRGEMMGDSSARAQSDFAIATAKARAGDIDAANSLPELARRAYESGSRSARSSFEARRIAANISASLGGTLGHARSMGRGAELEGSGPPGYRSVIGGDGPMGDGSQIYGLLYQMGLSAAARELRMIRVLEKWDRDGQPETRLET